MAHYDFYAKKKVTGVGALVNRIATKRLAGDFLRALHAGGGGKKSVLEIGPGKGSFASCIAADGSIDYKAYEGDALLYEELKSHGLNVVNAMVPPVPEPSASFDGVVLNNVLEHMPGLPAAEEIIRETCRILKEKGTFFIVVPNFLDWGKDFFNLDYTHQFICTESRLRQILEDNGFRVKKMAYHYGCFFWGIGRVFNACAKCGRAVLTFLLPRGMARKDLVLKLGVLFAENIICVAEKQ